MPRAPAPVLQSLVHQLVLHPAVSASLKVGATNVGRDKLYRTIQYAARFLAWCEPSLPVPALVFSVLGWQLIRLPSPRVDSLRKGYSKETVAKLSALKSQLALSRKRTFPALDYCPDPCERRVTMEQRWSPHSLTGS